MEYLSSVVGLSGAGKTTAIAGARTLLAAEGISSAAFHDRTSDAVSAKMDKVLHASDLSPEARMYLIIAARRQIIDRQMVTDVAMSAAHGAHPQRVFLLDIPAENAMQRMAVRGGQKQVFDDRELAFHERVREGYLDLAQANDHYVVIDSQTPQNYVAQTIARTIINDLRTN